MHQSSRPNTLLAIYLFDHNTLNSDHFIYGRVLDKLQQSYTQQNYPVCVCVCVFGGGGVIRLLMFAGPNKLDYNFIPDAINEREFM